MIGKGIIEEILNSFCNSYLLWFNSLATKNKLPLSHKVFIFFVICKKFFVF